MNDRTQERWLRLTRAVIGLPGTEKRATRPRPPSPPPADHGDEPGPRVLVVSGRAPWIDRVRAAVGSAGGSCVVCRGLETARALLEGGGPAGAPASRPACPWDVVLVDADWPTAENPAGRDAGLALIGPAARAGAACVLAAARPGLDLAVRAMREGAADLVLRAGADDAALAARLAAAAERSRNQRRARLRGRRRMLRLKADLRDAKRARPAEAPAGVADLLHAYLELTMKNATTATEFKGLIRAELDIEQLLRTTLEFVLSRSGPTNAAVFLPTTSGDYSLGAYVNYDCPKDACDVLLDHLANGVAPRFEGARGIVHVQDDAAFDRYIGDGAPWLAGQDIVGMACEAGGECLAVFMLFRDKRTPFPGPVKDQVRTVGDLFAAQLARVIHIHHRHLPKEKWGMLGDPPADDYGDLAA